jgi:hypothetical protein
MNAVTRHTLSYNRPCVQIARAPQARSVPQPQGREPLALPGDRDYLRATLIGLGLSGMAALSWLLCN